ncbi:hypothetical protein niasHS_001832 [Heterodera schachtii]|uniref:Uncharacterized protein n=1 Tax=Heterodera schachtii TaxID=97005 RepID=A0ABD2KAK7_HETSC
MNRRWFCTGGFQIMMPTVICKGSGQKPEFVEEKKDGTSHHSPLPDRPLADNFRFNGTRFLRVDKDEFNYLANWIHANSPYAEKYRQLEEKSNKDESQKKLSTFFPCSSGTLTVMDKKVVNFLVSTNNSFNVVNHPTFQSLVAPQQIKKEAHYRAEVLPEVYKQVKNKVRDELKECESISFTTDAWSGPTNNFLCLTAHGIKRTSNSFLIFRTIPFYRRYQ